jgi:Sulfotransferase family
MSDVRAGPAARGAGGADQNRARDEPIFIVGYMRSGTTMLRLMLNAHPGLALPPETELLQHAPPLLGSGVWQPGHLDLLVSRLMRIRAHLFELDVREQELSGVLRPILPASAPAIIATLYLWWAHREAGKRGVRWGDKKPSHWPFMSGLGRWFPGAQFIHLKRDPRDAIASMKQYFEMYIKGRSLLPSHVISAWYWRLMNLTIEGRGARLGPQRYMSLRYEDLVAQPPSHAQEICRFLGIEFAPAMIAYHEKVALSGRAGGGSGPFAQTARAPHLGRIGRGRWSLPEAELADIEFLCRDLMRRYGYDPYTDGVSAGRGAWLSSVRSLLPVPWAALRGWRRLYGSL